MGIVLSILAIAVKLVLFPVKLALAPILKPLRIIWSLAGIIAIAGFLLGVVRGDGNMLMTFFGIMVVWSATYGFVDWVRGAGDGDEDDE